jgi:hypothetical protein
MTPIKFARFENMPKDFTGIALFSNDDRVWYTNGKANRLDGPAVECENGSRFWYIDGRLHRENGPAVIFADGRRYFYIANRRIIEKAFWDKMNGV